MAEDEENYVLCRPLGGLNDILCQIETCWKYAESFNRTLIIDFQDREYPAHVFDCLGPLSPLVPVVINPGKSLTSKLNTMSCVPPQIRGRLSSYEAVQGDDNYQSRRFDKETGAELSFDMSRDHGEQVLVHHREGGGTQSFAAVSRLAIRTDVAQRIAEQFSSFPTKYDAAHVRATDYRTDFLSFFRRLGKQKGRVPLLVCSDSNEVLDYAEKHLLSRPVIRFPRMPVRLNAPIHLPGAFATKGEAREAAERLLAEMYGLSRARNLYITFVKNPRRRFRPMYSGFSLLIAHLHRQRMSLPFFTPIDEILGKPASPGAVVTLASLNYRFFALANQAKIRTRKGFRRFFRRGHRFAKHLLVSVVRTLP